MWMAENLDYRADSSWCYANEDSNCVKYGRLYNWSAAMSACPAGWRLSSRADWDDLERSAGEWYAGRNLKSGRGWNGSDDYGWSALPGGYCFTARVFKNIGEFGYWWSAAEHSKAKSYSRIMRSDYQNMVESAIYKNYAQSVRCVRK
ncbi:MAG: hypothetical protein FWC23_09970 [Chitinispirillia bacterium]|nr:hypothetical protein [Chitinispirillia bacterium]MCL2269496.1 hypothetical protein [Chitinispirillia bacterium]